MPISPEEFVAVLDGVRSSGNGWEARCPAHDDNRASLSVKGELGDNGGLCAYCSAGCEFQDIVESAGFEMSDVMGERRYEYTDAEGNVVGVKVRKYPKDMLWDPCKPKPCPLYRTYELTIRCRENVYLVEGEKDADNLHKLGLLGTTCGGANDWRTHHAEQLEGRTVLIIPDNDEPGEAFARQAAEELKAHGCEVRTLHLDGLPEKGDVSDWIQQGGTRAELERLANVALSRPEGWENVVGHSFEEVAKQVVDRSRFLKDNPDLKSSVPTHIPPLDKMLYENGLCLGDVHIVGAHSNSGKSSFCQSVAYGAMKAGYVVDYYTLEDRSSRTFRRMCSYELGIPVEEIRERAPEEVDNRIMRLVGELEHTNMYLSDSKSVKRTSESLLWHIEENARVRQTELIVVDYIQKLKEGSSQRTRVYELEEIGNELFELASRTNTAVLLASQVTASKDGKFVHLRDCTSLYNEAATVIYFTQRREDSEDLGGGVFAVTANVNKQKDGATGNIKLKMVPAFATFPTTQHQSGAGTPDELDRALASAEPTESIETAPLSMTARANHVMRRGN